MHTADSHGNTPHSTAQRRSALHSTPYACTQCVHVCPDTALRHTTNFITVTSPRKRCGPMVDPVEEVPLLSSGTPQRPRRHPHTHPSTFTPQGSAVGLWCLDPVEELPLLVQDHHHRSPDDTDLHPLLGGRGRVTALAWLSACDMPSLVGQPGRPLERAGSLGSTWGAYLACAAGGCVYVHAVRLPTSLAGCVAGGGGWRAQVGGCVWTL